MNGAPPPKQSIRSQPERPAPETALMVSQRLSAMVTALNLLRISLVMYPAGHSRIEEATDQAYEHIQKSLTGRSDLTLSLKENTLAWGDIPLDPNNSSVREYARTLGSFRLVAVSFLAGVKKRELIEFHGLLSQRPSDVWQRGTVGRAVHQAGITGIRIKSLDADDFQVTEEKEIFFTPAGKEDRKGDFWLDFLARSKELAMTVGDPALSPFLDASFQARALNERRDLWRGAAESYENLVREYFLDLRHGNAISPARVEALATISEMLKSLHPELRAQLLDSLERQICLQPESVLAIENLEPFPQELFMEMMHLAQERNTRMSPTLILLMQKMAAVHRQEQEATGITEEEEFTVGSIRDLIKRENYEKYVPADYARQLRDAAESPPEAPAREEAFPIHRYLQTLQEDQIQLRITYFSLVMMDEDVSDEEYRQLSQHLVNAAMGLLRTGQFSFLTEVLEVLRGHVQNRKTDASRQRALWALQAFTGRQSMPFVAPFLQEGAGESADVAAFLKACGEESLPWLFELYLDLSFTPSPFLLSILSDFGKKAGEEAYRRLRGQNPQGVARLLRFIREKAGYNDSSELRALFLQSDRAVRRDVLETLLQFEDPLALDLLRSDIEGQNWDERMDAVEIICRHRVWDLIDAVLGHVKTFWIGDVDLQRNERIIRAIASAGDPHAADHLERLSRVRWTLSPRRLARMKALIQQVLPAA